MTACTDQQIIRRRDPSPGIDVRVETRSIIPNGQHVWVRQGNGEVPGLLVWWENRNSPW